jgi:hypothetical protein
MTSPEVDYSPSAPEFVRQLLDHGVVYDSNARAKNVNGVSFILSANADGASREIGRRLQRHFAVLAIPEPDRREQVEMLTQFLEKLEEMQSEYDGQSRLNKIYGKMIEACVDVHHRVSELFIQSSARSHYVYAACDLQQFFDELIVCNAFREKPERAVKLWTVECRRVYAMRLGNPTDNARFWDTVAKTSHIYFGHELAQIGSVLPYYRSIADAGNTVEVGLKKPRIVCNDKDDDAFCESAERLVRDCRLQRPTLNPHIHETLLPELSHLLRALQHSHRKNGMLLIGAASSDLITLSAYICQYPIHLAGNMANVKYEQFAAEFIELVVAAGTKMRSAYTLSIP